MPLRHGESVSEDRALLRFSAAGFLDESPDLSQVLKACGDEVRSKLPEEEVDLVKEDQAK